MPPPPWRPKTKYRVAPGGVDFGGKPGGRRQGTPRPPLVERKKAQANPAAARGAARFSETRGAPFKPKLRPAPTRQTPNRSRRSGRQPERFQPPMNGSAPRVPARDFR